MKKILNILLFLSLLLVFTSIFSSVVLANSAGPNDACYDSCIEEFSDEMGQECYNNFHTDQLGDYCMDEHSSDYEDDCIDLYSQYTDEHFEDGADCLETHDATFWVKCLEDYEDELKDYCLEENEDEMRESCIDEHLSDLEGSDGCCAYDMVWNDDFSECISEEMEDCVNDGRCPLDDNWVSGDCDGYIGSNFPNPSGDCVSEDEANCWQGSGYWYPGDDFCFDSEEEFECVSDGLYWVDGICYDSEEEKNCVVDEDGIWINYLCFNSIEEAECYDAGVWSEEDEICYDSYEELNCMESDGFWIGDNCFYSIEEAECYDNGFWFEDESLCLDSEEELSCLEEGGFFYNSECFESEEIANCFDDGLVYCDSYGSCVESEDQCCDDVDLYVEFEGICADSSEEAVCLNDFNFWSEDESLCSDSEDELSCIDNSHFWSEDEERCFDSEDEFICFSNDGSFLNNHCIINDYTECVSDGMIYSTLRHICVNDEDELDCVENHWYGDKEDYYRSQNSDYSFVANTWVEETQTCYAKSIQGDYWNDEFDCVTGLFLKHSQPSLFKSSDYPGVWNLALETCYKGIYAQEAYDCEFGNELLSSSEKKHWDADSRMCLTPGQSPEEYCSSINQFYSENSNVCLSSLAEKDCADNHWHQSYGVPWIKRLHTCYAEEIQGQYWADMFECLGGDDFEEGAAIGTWYDDFNFCVYDESELRSYHYDKFLSVWNENTVVNINATRDDGFVELYSFDLDTDELSVGLNSNPNANLIISEDVLDDLLSLSLNSNVSEFFASEFFLGNLDYNVVKRHSFFVSFKLIFTNLFGGLLN